MIFVREFSFLRQRNENPIYCSWWRSNNDMGMLSFLFVHERSLLSNKSKDHLIKKINARRYRFHRIVRAKKIELTTTFDAHYEMKFSNSPHFLFFLSMNRNIILPNETGYNLRNQQFESSKAASASNAAKRRKGKRERKSQYSLNQFKMF